MIRIFKLVLLLVVSQVAFGQAPSNYTNINGRYRWIAGMFDSTFHIPKGTSPSLRTGGSTNAGGLFYNTSDSSVYTYTGTQWIKVRGSINPSDTTNKYVTQVYKKNGSDSVFYVKGGNHLWAFNDSTGSAGGGGGGKVYYFNGGVNMGTFGGFTMYELGDTANTGAAANFTRATTGAIANFITDPNKPGLLQIPAGSWTIDAWMSETGSGANHAQVWAVLEKWNGSTITTIATSPIEEITEGNSPNLYTWSISVPTTSLLVTDRIIIQFYITNTNGKTVTLYTQNGYVGEVHTTFTTGIGAINGLTAPAQYLVTGTSGTDFNISSVTATHTFNLPTASAINRGALSSADWTTFNSKLSPADTVSLSNRINLKLNISDTAAMLSPYARTNVVNAGLALKVNISDTSSMLSPYARKNFLNAGTGISYSSTTGTIANTAPDQTVALNAGTGISISGTYPNFTITNSSPSSGGTVTSVGSNNGTGLTGGPITTSGTLAIDTLLVSTRAWRQKGIDSVQANLTAGLALKVNISDTASMLSPYLKSNTAAATYVPQTRTITINGTSQDLTANRTYNVGTVTSVGATAGTGISVSGSPITSSGSFTITNTAPDQTVVLNNGTGISVSGTYPNFTITNTSPSSGGTVTSVGSGTGLSGGPITGSGTLSVDTLLMSTRAWRQKGIDSVQGNLTTGLAGKVNISDTASMLTPYLRKIDTTVMLSPYLRANVAAATYVPQSRTITINGTSQDLSANRTFSVGTVTSVGITAGTGISVANSPVTGSGNITVTNTAPDQTVTLSAGTGISIAGTYPSFTITNSSPSSGGTVTSVGSGTGLTGGPITTSGTLAVDTNLISTRLWRQKGVDSVAALANTKVSSVSGTSPISSSGGTSPTISISQASGSTNGFLSSTDWTTFNNKQNALTNPVTGTGTTNYIPKFTSSSAIGNSVIQEASGSIGINVSPVADLQVGKTSGVTIAMSNSNSVTSGARGDIAWYNSAISTVASIRAIAVTDNVGTQLEFYTRPAAGSLTQAMTLDASGNLGLGTSSPDYELEVEKAANPRIGITATNSTGVPELYMRRNGTTIVGYLGAGVNSDLTNIGDFVTLENRLSTGSLGFRTNGGTRAIIDASGNLGLGVTPSAWATYPAFQLGIAGVMGAGSDLNMSANAYFNAGWKYIQNGAATLYNQSGGVHSWYNTASGTANGAISLTQAMTLDASGNLNIGTTTNYSSARIVGNISSNAAIASVVPVLRLSNNGGGYITKLMFSDNNRGDAYITHYAGSAFDPTTRYLGFGVDAYNQMIINANGNVGIGTTSPDRPLDIYSASTVGIARIRANNVNGAAITIANDENLQGISIYAAGSSAFGISGWAGNAVLESGTGIVYSAYNGNHIFQSGVSGRTERMRITNGGDVGINTQTPNATFHVNGSIASAISIKTATYTLTSSDYTVVFDLNGNATANLPNATTCSGRIYVIKINRTNVSDVLTIDPNGAQTIDGNATYDLQCQQAITIQSDGSNWRIIGDYAAGVNCL